jgi:nucleotide-binding universal stress UspA family protein
MSVVTNTRVTVFDRVVVAMDGSPGSLEAATQADALRPGLGMIELVGVVQVSSIVYSAYGAPLIVADAERTFTDRFEQGRSACPAASAEVLYGPVVPRLLERLEDSHATLVAVGATDHSRPMGIVRGSVPTEMLHRAPCSVLVARRPPVAGSCFRSVIVGYDGSSGARDALAAGRDIAFRLGTKLRVVLADAAAAMASEELAGLAVERDERNAVDALREASGDADLLVVGSRGLHGLKAIGSVSERLGHRSACSVLIVRDAPGR